MDVFAPGAKYYNARPTYHAELFKKLADVLKIGPNASVLDLACGGGELAFRLSVHYGRILGVDNSTAMLAHAAAKRVPNVSFLHWDLNSDCLESDEVFDLVTIGRAIHYLDPILLKETLSRSLVHGGSVICCGAGLAQLRNPWVKALNRVVRNFQPEDGHRQRDFSGITTMKSIAFPLVEKVGHAANTTYDFDRMFNYSLSYRSLADAVLGRHDEFRAVLDKALTPFQREDGTFRVWEVSWAYIFQSSERG